MENWLFYILFESTHRVCEEKLKLVPGFAIKFHRVLAAGQLVVSEQLVAFEGNSVNWDGLISFIFF